MTSPVGTSLVGTHVSERIVEAVARREGVDPVDLETPLYEAIDTEALDALFTATDGGEDASLAVEFTYVGHDVRVTSTDVELLDDR